MSNLAKSPVRHIAIAIAVLTVLSFVPNCGWIVKNQLKHIVLPHRLVDDNYTAIATHYVATHPSDTAAQVCLVEDHDFLNKDQQQAAFDAVEQRNSSNPAVNACALAYESNALLSGKIEWKAAEFQSGDKMQKIEHDVPMPSAKEEIQLADFERQAIAGEKIDPKNAYFPWMLAAAYFAEHKDNLALSTIGQAGQDTQWRSYQNENFLGHVKLCQIVFGGTSGSNLEMSDGTSSVDLFPQVALERAPARMAVWVAEQDELSGHTADGIRIRTSVMHVGSLIRSQDTTLIGNLIGLAVVGIGGSKPGGVHLTPNMSLPDSQREQDLISRHLAGLELYLTKNGDPAEARWVKHETATDVQFKANVRALTSKEMNSAKMRPMLIDIVLDTATWLFAMWLVAFIYVSIICDSFVKGLDRKSGAVALGIIGAIGFLIALVNFCTLGTVWYSQTEFPAPPFLDSINPNGSISTGLILYAVILGPIVIYKSIIAVRAKLRKEDVVKTTAARVAKASITAAYIALFIYTGTVLALGYENHVIRHNVEASETLGEGQSDFKDAGLRWPGAQ